MDLIINGERANDHNLYLEGDYPDIPNAEKAFIVNRAPGSNSSVYQDDGYNDTTFTVNLSYLDFDKPYESYLAAVYWINKAETVSLDEWPFEYVVKRVIIENGKNELGVIGTLPVTFSIESFKYLKDSKTIEATNPANITNEGTMSSLPLWTIRGSGNGTLTVNDQVLNILDLTNDIVVDSKLMVCNHEDRIKGPYLELKPDFNRVSWTGGITSVTIEPRWRFS